MGFGVTGQATASALLRRGWEVTVADDRPSAASRDVAARLDLDYRPGPDPSLLGRLAQASDLTVVSPGVPLSHPVFGVPGVEPVSEIELASRWADRPMVAVTGTNGKTTVVTLITAMLEAAGRRAVAAGNIGLPLIEAVDQEADVLVVEVSSFQLQLTSTFHPAVAVWLNLAEDHLDWHPDMAHYAAAKARIWARQTEADTTVLNATDPAVMSAADAPGTGTRARRLTFGGPTADYRIADGSLVGPDGPIVALSSLARTLPHDLENYLAASAAASAAGAGPDACGRALGAFEGLPHRVSLVAEWEGLRFYDDSKSTTPASVAAALAGFDSVVLVAGGQNKGLDLGPLGTHLGQVRAVVAIGAAAAEVEAALGGARPVRRASSMDEAVEAAIELARPGDAVLLSPGCASFDWYSSYAERGDDFVRAVRARTGGVRT